MKKILFACTIFCLTFTVANAATLYSDPSKTILVERTKPQFTIKLASNLTTGYSWLLQDYDRHLLTLVKHSYQAPEKSMAGSEGYETWVFKVTGEGFSAPQITKIKLLYARPWNLTDNSNSVEFTLVTH